MEKSLNSLFNESEKNYGIISSTYKILEKSNEIKIPIHSAGQWLLDNMYIIDEEYELIKGSLKFLKKKKLPVIKLHDGTEHIAIFYLAYELVEKSTGYIDQNLILNTLREHQKLSYLSSEELDMFLLMLKIALLKFIARISLNISNSQLRKIDVEKILESENDDGNIISEMYSEFRYIRNFKDYVSDENKIKNTNTAFVEYMAYRLKEMGVKGEKYYKLLSDEAEKIGFTIEEAIIKEHMEIAKTTDYIGRAILSYKRLQGINFREIFENVNKIDETLKNDYTNEFIKCDYKTKSRYRNYVIKLAKKYKVSEVYIAKKVVECSNKYKKHVGFFLIGDEKYLLKKELGKSYISDMIYNNIICPSKPFIYIASLIVISLFITLLIGKSIFLFDNTALLVLAYIALFSLSLEVSDKIVNYALRKLVKPKILPRFDFAKTVDEKYPTYIVMPTIISSIEKLDNMISKMEVTYLANRSENMYYMLIGDCVSSDKEHIDIDDKIVNYAKEKLDLLNAKYPSNHKIFNFMYRKRVYSKGEGCFMGYERKRGALLHFNELILGKLSKEEINKKMYLIYDDIVAAKYAITLDEDSYLSLNTAKDLVAIISHPLNQPILSKNKKIVKKGYGLIQPSVGLDIEAANKSIFSKIFGGFGGLDIYTNAVSNTYQDVFNEAIFCGKGIYNIKLFEDLVAKEIPENLVLSHDLLEGSIIHAGLASDIELQDGFPNNYIAYMKRNHRWYRGDMQIIKWLLSPRSKLSLLSKWKIFDNIRRPLLDVISLIAIICTLIFVPEMFTTVVLGIFIAINFGLILSILDILIYGKFKHTKELQYIPIIHGIWADLLTMCFNFVTMPYKAFTCISAFSLSLYRMLISKKNLLQWTTGETLEKMAKSSLSYYLYNMIINEIVGIVILAIGIISKPTIFTLNFEVFVAFSFIFAPVFAYLTGKDHIGNRKKKLDKNQENEVLEIAKRTWLFFDQMMTATNNYLPTDNYQENRRYKIANRTSSTNIGFGILSIIDAYDLGFISKDEMLDRLQNIYLTVEKLEKWKGHLYNWYNIKTLEPLRPRFVSTVDSGNFVACLYVAREFFKELVGKNLTLKKVSSIDQRIKKLYEINQKLIENVDFTELYNTSRNLFSIGYNQEAGTLADSYYDMLMSESRTTSLIAIATRQVTSKHWFALSRNLVKVDGYKGLTSWTGTAFEYFMPYIFNKSYEHTLIDQSLFFTEYSQIKYAKANNVPWGISECAYAMKDNDLNYQYKAFGIPWLGLKRGLNDYLIISPYSSLLMIEYDPERVYKNIKKLKELGLYSSYGFYESIDYSKQHLSHNVTSEIAKTYMAHHQGMILASINNYINKGIIKNRFHRNPEIKACEILLKEREKMKAILKKKTNDTYNRFTPKGNDSYTTFVSCAYFDREHLDALKPDGYDMKIAFIKGANMSALIANNGAEYIRYKDKIMNRQRYTEPETTGNYIYITDKATGKIYSLTNCDINSKFNKDVKKCNWISTLNSIENYIEGSNIEASTTTFFSPEYNAQIKKVSLYNNSNIRREILINTMLEPAMTDYMTNIVHPSFSNLQIETYYDNNLDALIASKRKKSSEDSDLFIFSKMLLIDLEKDVETEKMKLIKNDSSAYDGNVSRYPLWAVLSYRATIILDPYERQEFYYIVGMGNNKYKISNAIVSLDSKEIENQYKLSCEMSDVVTKYLKLEPTRAEVYNNIIKDALFKRNGQVQKKYWDETLSQSLLWKYSISGDLPIILVYVDKIEDAGIVNEVINFMDYVKNRKVDLDIVILINENEEINGPVYTYIKTRLDRAVYMDYSNGGIYLLNIKTLTKQEITLLSFLSKRYIQDVNELMCVVKENDDESIKLVETKEKSDVKEEGINEK